MASLIRINKNKKLEASKTVYNHLSPDYIYIPYKKDDVLYFKTNDSVLKDDIVISNDKNNIYSSVSGKVLGMTKMFINNEETEVVVIENDFKEKTKKIKGVKKHLNNYSKEEILSLVSKFNFVDCDFSGEVILVNGIDYEVYENNKSALIKKYINEILEVIDALFTIFNAKKSFLAIKNNDSENVDLLIHHIGTYPNIDLKMLPDLYPLGHKDILKKELIMPKDKQNGIMYFDLIDIYNIYNILKRQRPVTEKYITISGDLVVTPKVINVKIGSSLKDILVNNIKLKNDNYKIIVNGLLSGYEVPSSDLIITKEINSVFINTVNNDVASNCINCGMCHTKCPAGVDPRTGKNKDKCIKCGICTYVCPAKINFKKVFKK
ncbi:MAG: 4Fe-4S dicluster domain-containing protein [Bacilli bacterium]|nr:4Fe-4S dicluster domain-containing protein [Bacilli bacterium]